jgi:hypothetical protein
VNVPPVASNPHPMRKPGAVKPNHLLPDAWNCRTCLFLSGAMTILAHSLGEADAASAFSSSDALFGIGLLEIVILIGGASVLAAALGLVVFASGSRRRDDER